MYIGSKRLNIHRECQPDIHGVYCTCGGRYHVEGMPVVNEGNTAPHLPTAQDTLSTALGDWEKGIAISCTECSQVAGLIQKVGRSSSKALSLCAACVFHLSLNKPSMSCCCSSKCQGVSSLRYSSLSQANLSQDMAGHPQLYTSFFTLTTLTSW